MKQQKKKIPWNKGLKGKLDNRIKMGVHKRIVKYYKNSNITSILQLRRRRILAIIKKYNLTCCICSWNKEICDFHHIRGKKISDPDNHHNLTYVCPNCHRLLHKNKIKKRQLISLEKLIGKNIKDVIKDFNYWK